MRKSIFLLILLGCIKPGLNAVAQGHTFADTASLYFDELRVVTKKNQALWNRDIYAPMLLADPSTRLVYANEHDTGGVFKSSGAIYSGKLPASVNISNTSLRWGGKHWAMVMLPLSANKNNRLNLLTHELFHRAQHDLGFKAYNPDNSHLDKKAGRVYLRLELEALKMAVMADSFSSMRDHIQSALLFRSYRHVLFPMADSTENLLELNEGICEYTGMMMSGRNDKHQRKHLAGRMDEFMRSASYIRSFAYETTPVYGYLLYRTDSEWNLSIDSSTNLTDYFRKAFAFRLNAAQENLVSELANRYNGKAIEQEESDREQKLSLRLAAYRRMFLDTLHVEIPLITMNMSFDYTRMISLGNDGTVYPQIRITDQWGILEVEQGALITPQWNKVHLSFPAVVSERSLAGEGWKLELKSGYSMKRDDTGNYFLRKE